MRDRLLQQRYADDEQRQKDWVRKGKDDVHGPCSSRDDQDWPSEGRRGFRGDRRERKQGTYVRKVRQDHENVLQDGSYQRVDDSSKKRGPKQIWVAKDNIDRQASPDVFIRDTRRKTASVFERISDRDDTSADPARRGRRSP